MYKALCNQIVKGKENFFKVARQKQLSCLRKMFRSLLIGLGRLKETRNKLLTENTVLRKIVLNC